MCTDARLPPAVIARPPVFITRPAPPSPRVCTPACALPGTVLTSPPSHRPHCPHYPPGRHQGVKSSKCVLVKFGAPL